MVVNLEVDCNVFYADPRKVRVQYFPDLATAINHERCHCEDWKAAYQQFIDEVGKAEYVSKSECQKAKKTSDLEKRVKELIEPSLRHELQKYREGGSCFAHSSW